MYILKQNKIKKLYVKIFGNEADIARQVRCAEILLAGFTTVRDLGGTGVNIY
jgi:hypothetical protein